MHGFPGTCSGVGCQHSPPLLSPLLQLKDTSVVTSLLHLPLWQCLSLGPTGSFSMLYAWVALGLHRTLLSHPPSSPQFLEEVLGQNM